MAPVICFASMTPFRAFVVYFVCCFFKGHIYPSFAVFFVFFFTFPQFLFLKQCRCFHCLFLALVFAVFFCRFARIFGSVFFPRECPLAGKNVTSPL